MMNKKETTIAPLRINKLRGRFLRHLGKTNREILLVYDVPMNLELIKPLSEFLGQYGNVTAPDLPGVGGMSSFYSISRKPNLNAYAAYLASFIKLRYRHRRLTLVGIGYSVTIITKMIQTYPQVAKKVDLVVSLDGFVHHEDIVQKSVVSMWLLHFKRTLQSWSVASWVARITSFSRSVTESFVISKKLNLEEDAQNQLVAAWQQLDIRSYRKLQAEQLSINLCKRNGELEMHHIHLPYYNYRFDHETTSDHIKIAYKYANVTSFSTKLDLVKVITDQKTLARALYSLRKKI